MQLDWMRRIALFAVLGAFTVGVGACGSDNSDTNGDNDKDAVSDVTDALDTEQLDGGNDIAEVGPSDGETGGTDAEAGPVGIETLKKLDIPGLDGDADIRFDKLGIPHVDCQTNRDCYTIQGYLHAYFRFFEMDLARRQVTGRLSEIAGEVVLERDAKFRHLMTTRQGEPLENAFYDALGSKTKNILKAYTKGVNAWIDDWRSDENGARLTDEYNFALIDSSTIADWDPRDSIALYLILSHQLSNNTRQELLNGRAFATLPPAVARDLFTPRPGVDSAIMDVAANQPQTTDSNASDLPTVDHARQIHERLAPADSALAGARQHVEGVTSLLLGQRMSGDGSNNWVVAPQHTEDGNALLANDPHLELQNPPIWYYVELDSKTNGKGDLHVAGASVPSVPGVIIGQNEKIAWGVTTARLDLSDLYIETLSEDGEGVMFEGQKVSFIEKEFTFDVNGASPQTKKFKWVPHHGPVISIDRQNGRAVTLKWTTHGAGKDISFLYDLMHASTVDEAMSSIETVRSINQSFVFIDQNGSIAWYPHGAIPKRPWASTDTPTWLPLPGDGSAEWQGFVSSENIPRLVNPPAGYIATANNDIDGSYFDGDATNESHPVWQRGVVYGARHKRISTLLENQKGQHSRETMADIQADTKSLLAEQLVPQILSTVETSDVELTFSARKVVESLANWNYTCPTGLDGHDPQQAGPTTEEAAASESIACSTFHVMLPILVKEVFGDELTPLRESDNLPDKWGAIWQDLWQDLQVPLKELFVSPDELARGNDYFDNQNTSDTTETRAKVVANALDQTATKLQITFDSSDPDDWRWGRVHTVQLASLFSSFGVETFDYGPFANDGGLFTVDVAAPNGTTGGEDKPMNLSQSRGASLRAVFEAGENGMRGSVQLPGGQNLHRDGKWYGTMMENWLDNTPTELLFERSDVEEASTQHIEVAPADQ